MPATSPTSDALNGAKLEMVKVADVDTAVNVPCTSVQVSDTASLLLRGATTFDLVFCDPPYETDADEATQLLRVMSAAAPGGTIVFERGRRSAAPVLPTGWSVVWERLFGDTLVQFIQPVNESERFDS